ncbi:MAG: PDZ domain-containing protein [Gemmatimonadaceae bacterium]|nr:PDZ domain-containing protein [Gemmatimonadaceae bacterium]
MMTRTQHTRRRWPVAAAVAAAAAMMAPLWQSAAAQSTTVKSTVRMRAPAMANACEELASSPSALAQAPEGLALLRLKRELEGAVETLQRNQQLQREQVRQLSQVQRGVDSAMQVVVRYFGRNGAPEEVVTIRRGDSARVVTPQGRTIETRSLFLSFDSTMRAVGPAMIRGMGPAVDVMVRALQPQVAALAGAAEAQIAERAPSGYVGVSLSGAQVRLVTPEGVVTSHCEYPLVESVDAGSPAEKAGLAAGDTVVAYNGRDVTQQAINYSEMLVPGSTLRVRVRKSGKPREVPVVVAARREEPRKLMMVRVPPPPSAPPVPPAVMMSGTGVAVLAGAQFSTIDDDFASTLDLEAGVLVLRVPPGTPAAEAGLRAGEVVVRVNGQRVRDVAALRRAIAGGGDVKLGVQSRAGERLVVLRGR